jgi:hypothetical protein
MSMDGNVIAEDKKKKKTKVYVWCTNQWIAMWEKKERKKLFTYFRIMPHSATNTIVFH